MKSEMTIVYALIRWLSNNWRVLVMLKQPKGGAPIDFTISSNFHLPVFPVLHVINDCLEVNNSADSKPLLSSVRLLSFFWTTTFVISRLFISTELRERKLTSVCSLSSKWNHDRITLLSLCLVFYWKTFGVKQVIEVEGFPPWYENRT